ncbi:MULTISPECIES: carboxy-S-adenosyl-L-methionine synthase CmoA [unclassified Campylobacter]|uniref:carboxy-S-adenosyl-L-methionine synthase CmoA n=1 Tax=unclassified Campylobacter TaxID=2593542 RepID=UPI0012380CDC|nr:MULTISPECIES: carboxy-S-adenosyl-L-methionine synthase CmoA [unclassified Campylobacter]KAA6226359.1 carboxy-S-adenosyl-L-methionine synthase CmoA [Campylobacter sp. LR286c]KAA6226603.1 carboxy-S-adenosyl-L-methionine synthase CmoA [Campylobacter sp. LR185c]KAA6226851.1 carboxy-S-adenosyl-L-methionine synthase CmoA [Campylobacter sp. LR196d]KAA6230288.1 carboxy-S-adenosyl-L-methionine synthase CmoA [Campylobacter sp. LR291e]KAA6233809.1 carboxy-S-adenosyl-L-methionine synthase CmoA [Campylo
MRDKLFQKTPQKQFEFDKNVASVFDDMLKRSIPFYSENLNLCANIIAKMAKKNAKICDLGSSTANLLIKLFELRKDFLLCGVDEASAMLDLARTKAKAYGTNIEFIQANLNDFNFFKNDIFIASYTLQFIRPMQRQALVDKIYKFLNKGGFFILSEKILYENAKIAKIMIELYFEFKQRQGYSEFEIASKREALENVLIPYTQKENIKMLENAGFSRIESIFKWANFESFIAFK